MSIWCGIGHHHATARYEDGKQVGWQCIVCNKPTQKPYKEYIDNLSRTIRVAKSLKISKTRSKT